MPCRILPIAFDQGAGLGGCMQAPQAILSGGLVQTLRIAGQRAEIVPFNLPDLSPSDGARCSVRPAWQAVAALVQALSDQAFHMSDQGFPVFLGGDHSVSAGTIAGLARQAARCGRPLFVLWLDAHPDFHTLATTQSGNLHGVPLAYVAGQSGFSGLFPRLEARIEPERICVMGVRSVDAEEQRLMGEAGLSPHPMAELHRIGIEAVLAPFLDRVERANGLLHVSLDFDFLDPQIAGAVGTPVPDGATWEQMRRIIALIAESGLMSSLDLVEYNPVLDRNGQTLRCVLDLAARMIGARGYQRPVRAA